MSTPNDKALATVLLSDDGKQELSKGIKHHKDTSTRIVIEHKDRLTRFGANYIFLLLEAQGRTVEIVNLAEDDKEDLVQDLSSIFYSFCARCMDYAVPNAKRKPSSKSYRQTERMSKCNW